MARARINKITGKPIRTHKDLINKYIEVGYTKKEALSKRRWKVCEAEYRHSHS